MSCVQIFPIGDATTADLQRFVTNNAGIEARFAQIEQASYDVRVGYAGFLSPEIARSACSKLNKANLNGIKVHARVITPVEDDYGILVGPKGFVQNNNRESGSSSRYYPGQANSPAPGSSKRHTNRRSYQQQQTDPRNFGGIASKYNDNTAQQDNQPAPPFQQNPIFPPTTANRQPQYPEQGFDQRNVNAYDNSDQYERISSQFKDSKSKSSSKHKKHRRDSSDSSSSSSESSDSSPKQSRHKHRHHHHHHRRSK